MLEAVFSFLSTYPSSIPYLLELGRSQGDPVLQQSVLMVLERLVSGDKLPLFGHVRIAEGCGSSVNYFYRTFIAAVDLFLPPMNSW